MLSVDIANTNFLAGRDHDRIVVGFTTTCAISVYHYKRCEFESG